jgi:hypothetical protein
VPAPVTVSVLPETEHDPDDTLKETASPEGTAAESEIGDTPYVTGLAGGAKVIV